MSFQSNRHNRKWHNYVRFSVQRDPEPDGPKAQTRIHGLFAGNRSVHETEGLRPTGTGEEPKQKSSLVTSRTRKVQNKRQITKNENPKCEQGGQFLNPGWLVIPKIQKQNQSSGRNTTNTLAGSKQATETHNHAEALMKPRSELGQKESVTEQAQDVRWSDGEAPTEQGIIRLGDIIRAGNGWGTKLAVYIGYR